MPSQTAGHIRELMTDIFSPKFIPALIQGMIIGAILVIVEVSFASIIFSGPLTDFASRAAGMCIFGSAALCLFTGMFSPSATMISLPQDTPVAILSVTAASIMAALSTASVDTMFATVAGTVMSSALVTALFFWVIGKFKLSNFARFLPFPVIAAQLPFFYPSRLRTRGRYSLFSAPPILWANSSKRCLSRSSRRTACFWT